MQWETLVLIGFLVLVLSFVVIMLIDGVIFADQDGIIAKNIGRTITKNRLMKCIECNRIYRNYQFEVCNDEQSKDCPHCGTYQFLSRRSPVKRKAKWMDIHPDCPKINLYRYLKLKLDVMAIRKVEKQIADQEYYEEYNKLHVDMKWIENLTKRGK